MRRQGKYTKRVTPVQHAKRHVKQHFQWWRKLSWKKRIAIIVGPILAFLIILPLVTYWYFSKDIADQDRLMNRNNTGIVLYANDGKTEVYRSGRAEHRTLVPLDKMSESVKQAVIASEDKDFYEHSGFSVFSTVRAVYGYVVSGGGGFGGSTITQQLAKITVLSSNRSFLRQYQAFSVAVAIENTYSKDQILEMYLNSVYFGENAFGIEAAAKTYFGTTPDKLDLAQSAMLIGVLPAPSVYSPVSGNAEYAKERQTTVLNRMVTNKYISKEQKDEALTKELAYEPPRSPMNDSIAPHFAGMVLDELYEKYGEETVTRSGYQVTTTLDANVQNQLKTAIAGNMGTIRQGGGTNASSVAIDPTTGEVRGLVGSYDWSDKDFGNVNIATSLRQPGSSFKPIYYAQALAQGLVTPATTLKDERTDFGGGYVPQNADRRFRGDVTVRNALDWSLNIPAIKVMQKVGVSETVETARKMGLTSVEENKNYGLSLALGSAEVSLLSLTNVYAAFANQGSQYDTSLVRSIDSKYGDKVFTAQKTSKQVITPQGAFLISDILSDNSARASVFGGTLNVQDSRTRAVKKVAVKTGTTNDSRDAWTVGYTPQLAVGVWVGNNDNTAMRNGGATMAGPIFTKAMGAIMAGVDTSFPQVDGVVQRNICFGNRGISTEAIKGKTYTEWFLTTALPDAQCSVEKETPSPSPTPTPSTTPEPEDEEVSVTVSASPAGSAPIGTMVTITATITGGATGNVVFKDGNRVLGVSPIVGGVASISTNQLPMGMRRLTATYTPPGAGSEEVEGTLQYQITNN